MSPALAGKFFTTEPSGKPSVVVSDLPLYHITSLLSLNFILFNCAFFPNQAAVNFFSFLLFFTRKRIIYVL